MKPVVSEFVQKIWGSKVFPAVFWMELPFWFFLNFSECTYKGTESDSCRLQVCSFTLRTPVRNKYKMRSICLLTPEHLARGSTEKTQVCPLDYEWKALWPWGACGLVMCESQSDSDSNPASRLFSWIWIQTSERDRFKKGWIQEMDSDLCHTRFPSSVEVSVFRSIFGFEMSGFAHHWCESTLISNLKF